MMLGTGKQKELLELAKLNGLDLLAVFDVTVSVSSQDEPKNSTMLTVYDVKTGEKVVSTRHLTNLAYAKAREEGRDDQIETELDKIFQENTDTKYKASAMPDTLKADIAASRVARLLEQEYTNPLPVLAEIRYYMESGLISESDFLSAAEKLIGPENAKKLGDSDVAVREEAIKPWLPGQFTLDDSGAGFR
jgi:hypothetical protein